MAKLRDLTVYGNFSVHKNGNEFISTKTNDNYNVIVDGGIKTDKLIVNDTNIEQQIEALKLLLLQKGIIKNKEEFNDILKAIQIADDLERR